MTMAIVPSLETPRLRLRPITLADASAMFALNSDPEVMRYTGEGAFADMAAAEAFLAAYDPYSQFQCGRMTLVLKATDEVIGWCGLKYHPDKDETDVGYRLMRRHWGKGYATESSRAALADGFTRLALTAVVANVHPDNHASRRVVEKLNFVHAEDREWGGDPWQIWRIDRGVWETRLSE
jgi:[ribosomal protein S5]-alanine N-acetyltransferase